MLWDKRLPSGYSDLGPIEIAPTAQAIVLTDRADGSLWMISFNGEPRLSIVTDFATLSRKEGVRLYAADDGPAMTEDGEFRLIIRGGRLGLEYIQFTVGVQARTDRPPFARTLFKQLGLNMDSTDPTKVHIELTV